jgi:adenylyltransferase/sulfurtransferase
MQFISTNQLKDGVSSGKYTVIDVREPYERAICSINSLHIPMGEIETKYVEIPKDKDIVILCKSGRRAEAVAHYLEKEHNYKNISVLSGGIIAWIEEVDTHLESY